MVTGIVLKIWLFDCDWHGYCQEIWLIDCDWHGYCLEIWLMDCDWHGYCQEIWLIDCDWHGYCQEIWLIDCDLQSYCPGHLIDLLIVISIVIDLKVWLYLTDWFIHTFCLPPRYGPGRQSRQQSLVRLNQLQQSIVGWEGKAGLIHIFLISF
jgi:hypothetical protein